MLLAGSYALWVEIFKLFVLTIITYVITANASHPTKFDEITETFGSSEMYLSGLSALIFVLLMRGLNPLTSTTGQEIFSWSRLEKKFLHGFLNGTLLAILVVFAFLVSGLDRYYGFYSQFDEASSALVGVIFKTAAILVLVYCEEFIFRHKLLRQFRRYKGGPSGDFLAAGFTAILYALIKRIQFDLGTMQMITVFLLGLTLALRSFADQTFERGAGFLAALLIVFQPLLSLPVLGSEYPGIVLVKYQGNTTNFIRMMSGGAGGPFAGIAFQLVLVWDIVRGVLNYRKGILNLSTANSKL